MPVLFLLTVLLQKNKVVETTKIKTELTAKNFGFVGSPFFLGATTFGIVGEELYSGKYFCNFGDGSSKELKFPESKSFSHTYSYPGNYLISLSYYQNDYAAVPDTVSNINVKIVGTNISISNVGNEKDFFVELSNNTDYDADISNWVLASLEKSFTIPRNTILQTKNKMVISPKLTNFSIDDKNTLRLVNAEGDTIVTGVGSVPGVGIPQGGSPTPGSRKEKNISDVGLPQSGIPTSENLDVGIPQGESPASGIVSTFVIIFFVIFIGASAGVVYFIRRKKIILQPGDDFKILDE